MKKCLLPLLLVFCAFASSALSQSLFVVTRVSDAVAVIDSSTDQITTTIHVGNGPIRIAMSPDRLKAYVSNSIAGTVSVLDTVALATTATIHVGANPQESAFTPDGGRLYLVHESTDFVTVIDTATDLVITNVVIGGKGNDVLFALDGRFAYIANFSEGTVDVIDTATYQVTMIANAARSSSLATSPTGYREFVTNVVGHSLSVIDSLTQRFIAIIPGGNCR